MWIVKIVLKAPHTFAVLAKLVMNGGVLSVLEMPKDIFRRSTSWSSALISGTLGYGTRLAKGTARHKLVGELRSASRRNSL
jgi:hypothetical protein